MGLPASPANSTHRLRRAGMIVRLHPNLTVERLQEFREIADQSRPYLSLISMDLLSAHFSRHGDITETVREEYILAELLTLNGFVLGITDDNVWEVS